MDESKDHRSQASCVQLPLTKAMLPLLAAGHSLGGALATLAAYDIRKLLLDNKQSHTEVVCYTFAAPRTGNHAFAREYNAMVPDTWSVINDQVTHLTCLWCYQGTRYRCLLGNPQR